MKISKLFSRLPANLSGAEQSLTIQPSKPAISDLKLLIFIADWSRVNDISGVFQEENVGFHVISKGRGTASSEILDLLGIGASEKAMVICVEQPERVPNLLRDVRKKLGSRSPGAGIAFTVPLSGINSPLLRIFRPPEPHAPDGQKPAGAPGGGAVTHALVVSVVSQGYSDEVMNTARKAGAGGGTVLGARSQGHEGETKLFGISVQEEKEVILILAGREKKDIIIQAIREAHGPASKAQGIVVSLPVDGVMSLNFEQVLYT